MDLYRLIPGTTRLLVSIPHAGTYVPPAIAGRMTEGARALPDTDWHVDRVYDFLAEIGATVLIATHSRYVVDLNRPPDDAALYPGLAGSGLCPVETFDGEPIWQPRHAPAKAEIASVLPTTGSHTMLACARSLASCAPATAQQYCGMHIRSGAGCRACFRASCPC